MRAAANPHLSTPVVRAGCDPANARCAAILVHGRGREPDEMVQLARRLALDDVCYLVPTAHQNTWYPLGFMAPLAENQPWLDHALARLDALVAELNAQGFPRERIVLTGFSQGACLVLEYSVRNAGRYGGIVAWTGGLIGPPGTQWPRTGDFAGTPVFLGSSDVDEWVPEGRVRESAAVLEGLSARVQLKIYPGMDHIVCDDEISEARRIFAAVR